MTHEGMKMPLLVKEEKKVEKRFTDLPRLETMFFNPAWHTQQGSSLSEVSQVTPVNLFTLVTEVCSVSCLLVLQNTKNLCHSKFKCEITGCYRLIKIFVIFSCSENSFPSIPDCLLFKDNYLGYIWSLNISIFS